jgi:geranylgeranyl diphosphate synthase type II
MPCFDNAALRRGKPSVHAEFGEALALLTGDALIIMAYQVLADGAASRPSRFHALVQIVNASVGLPRGIVAGQALECESEVDLETYHRAKTGALFAAASMAGAAAAGVEHAGWEQMGSCLGEAYQVADDLLDIYGDPEFMGKPVGRDGENNRPNVVNGLGLEAATKKLNGLIAMVEASVPDCDGREELQALIEAESRAFVDVALGRRQAA